MSVRVVMSPGPYRPLAKGWSGPALRRGPAMSRRQTGAVTAADTCSSHTHLYRTGTSCVITMGLRQVLFSLVLKP